MNYDDDKKIDNTEVTVNSGSNNKIEYTSEEITATDVTYKSSLDIQ